MLVTALLFGFFVVVATPVVLANQITLPFGHEVEGIKHLPDVGLTTIGGQTVGTGVQGFQDLLKRVGGLLTLVLGSIAVLMLFIAGYQLVTAQSSASEEMTKQKMNVVYIMLGLVVFSLSASFVYNLLYQGEGVYLLNEQDALGVANQAVIQIKTIVRLFLSFSGSAAILVLVIASMRLIANAGDEDQINKQKKIVGYAAMGIIIIGLAETLVDGIIFGQGGYAGVNVPAFEQQLQGLSNYILGFLGVVIFVTFVISGVVMVGNFGNEDMVSKVKSTLKNVVIGVFVAYSAYTIVATLLRTVLAA
ncbi:MAG: hypothetical protein Q8O95_04800 [bacterium]|nr:hypothetical protein [bacterium]